MMSLEVNQSYLLAYDYANLPTNMSYSGTFYGLQPGDYLIINHTLTICPDLVKLWSDPLTQGLSTLSSANHIGDWYWDNKTNTISYIIINKQIYIQDIVVYLQILKYVSSLF